MPAAREAVADAKARGWVPGARVGVISGGCFYDMYGWAEFSAGRGPPFPRLFFGGGASRARSGGGGGGAPVGGERGWLFLDGGGMEGVGGGAARSFSFCGGGPPEIART